MARLYLEMGGRQKVRCSLNRHKIEKTKSNMQAGYGQKTNQDRQITKTWSKTYSKK